MQGAVDRFAACDYLTPMSVKPLVILPDPILRRASEPVSRVDDALKRFTDDMLETMYDAPGIGLAAIQVGEPLRIVTIDLSKEDDPEKAPQVFLNPEILASSDERSVYEEGCLSIPDYYAEVERPAKVTVRYLGLDGKTHEIEATASWPPVSSTRSTISTAYSSSTTSSKLKRDMVIRKFSKASKRGGA